MKWNRKYCPLKLLDTFWIFCRSLFLNTYERRTRAQKHARTHTLCCLLPIAVILTVTQIHNNVLSHLVARRSAVCTCISQLADKMISMFTARLSTVKWTHQRKHRKLNMFRWWRCAFGLYNCTSERMHTIRK